MIRSLTSIEQDFNSQRMLFNLARADLARVLVPSASADETSDKDALDRLINTAAEFGVDHAIATIADTSNTWGSRVMHQQTLKLAEALLNQLQTSESAMDRLVAEKSAAMQTQDASSPNLHQLHGEEIVIDVEAGKVFYPATRATGDCTVDRVATSDDDHDWDDDHARS